MPVHPASDESGDEDQNGRLRHHRGGPEHALEACGITHKAPHGALQGRQAYHRLPEASTTARALWSASARAEAMWST